MPIKWSPLRVSEAMEMAEELVNQVGEPLESAKIVATEARKIANLPQYLDQHLARLIGDIQRINNIKSSIKAVREDIPDGAIGVEQKRARHGNQQALI